MSKIIKADFKGLSTSAGQMVRPAGATIVQQNMNVEAPGIMRLKRGNAIQPEEVGGPIWAIFSTRFWGTQLFINYGDLSFPSLLALGDGTAPPTVIGTLNNYDPALRMKGAFARPGTYLTSSDGVVRVDSAFTQRFAGMPQGMGIDLVQPPAVLIETGGYLPDGYSVAYRVTFHLKTPDGQVTLSGAPTGRTVVSNKAGTSGYSAGVARNVAVSIPLSREFNTPSTNLTTSHFYRLWRTRSFNTTEPDDECQLVYEAFLTAPDIAAGTVGFADRTPQELLGAFLNTNPNSGAEESPVSGIANADMPPPVATDVAYWSDCMWYANTTTLAQQYLTLLSVVPGVGLSVGDVITIGAVPYTAVAGAPGANQFNIETTLTTSKNIEKTCLNLTTAINRSLTNTTVWAFYVNGTGNTLGQILIQARQYGTNPSISMSAHQTAFRPPLTTGITTRADTQPNALYYSKATRPDAVPVGNFFTVGPYSAKILRIVPLEESLFVFTDMGLYRVTGSTFFDFQVRGFDLNFKLLARECVATLDGALYAWGYDGIARITSTGVEYLSLPIKETIESILNVANPAAVPSVPTTMDTFAFAVADIFMHRVYFWYPDSNIGGGAPIPNYGCALALVYDVRTQSWSTAITTAARDGNGLLTDTRSCGLSRELDNYLMHGNIDLGGGDSQLWVERRAYNDTDYTEGASARVVGSVQFVFDNPAPGSNVHWREIIVYWEKNDTFAYRDPPTAPVIQVNNDLVGTSAQTTVAPQGQSVSRYLVPQNNRRAKRLSITINPNATAEYAGIEAVVVEYDNEDAKGMVR